MGIVSSFLDIVFSLLGIASSLLDQGWPPKTKFTVDDIPDLTGKVIVVTGANSGLGKEMAKALLAHNAKVYIAARNQEKAELAIKELKVETGKEGIFLKLDLSDLKSIKASAEDFLSKEKELHVLFNNAGVMVPPIGDITAQEYDLQFGTNVLGPFYFTKLVLPALLAGAKTSPNGRARVVNTSSSASLFVSGIDFNTFNDTPARKKKTPEFLYSQSKLGNVLFSNELARRYGDQGIVSTAINPGNLHTPIQRHLSWFQARIVNLIVYPAPCGALTPLYAGTSPQAVELNGEYLIPWARVGTPNPIGLNTKLAEDLWKWMEEQVEKIQFS